MDRENHPAPVELVEQLASSELFSGFEKTVLQGLEADLTWVTLGEGEVLFRRGDVSDALYVVAHGQLQVAIAKEDGVEQVVDEIGPGGTAGETEILTGEPRAATVSARSQTDLVKCSTSAFDRLAKKHPQILKQMSETITRRLRRNQLLEMLPDLFGTLDSAMLEDIEAELEWMSLDRGQALLLQEDVGDSLYIVISGRLQVMMADEAGSEQLVAEVMPGESVGEMEMLAEDPVAASIYAARDSELVRFSKQAFDRLVTKYPQVMRRITQLVIRRLQRNIRGVAPAKARTNRALDIVLLPVGPDVPLADFARRLAAALKAIGPVLILDSERFDHYLGRPGSAQIPTDAPEDARLVFWLNRQETRYRFIIYQADASVSHWTKRCLRQADQVLVVGLTGSDPALGEGEAELFKRSHDTIGMRRLLVLIHPDGSKRPSGTRKWLDAREVEQHYHVRWDSDADFRRLARCVAGRAVGLVLGGGGARGFAHIGVIRALEEADVPIDLIGGTSAGAIISALYAFGWECDTIVTKCRTSLQSNDLLDLTLPFVAVTAGRKRVAVSHDLFGDAQIEDLWLPYFCVTSNITHAEMVVHRIGSVWLYAFASGALPGVFPPVVFNGDLLVDGAVFNNLPMDVMRELCGGGTVIAVDVSPPVDLAENPSYEYLSGWSILWNRINPFAAKKQPMPNIAKILQRVGDIRSVHTLKRQIEAGIADLHLCPPVAHFDTLDSEPMEEIIQAGYEHARERIAQWRRSVGSTVS